MVHGLEADMNREKIRLALHMCFYLGFAMLAAPPVLAQVPVDGNGDPIAPIDDGVYADDEAPLLTVEELEAVVGPVALYPDDLLAIVLPASTYPLQIVQAARFLEQLEDDPTLEPDEEWDESITALLNYPEVVELMNEDIDWTWRLGEAVVAQQADVISAIEAFRDRAYAAGNLKTDEHQTVSTEDGVIEIEPVEEDVIYVPYYEPERVVVYQPYPVYHYYPSPYPLYYYPYPYGYTFHSGFFWGVTTAFTIGWLTDHLHVYHHSYWGHPYYGRHYHSHYYYRRPSLTVFNYYYVLNSRNHWNYRYRDGDYWRPRRHGGARPGQYTRRVTYYRDDSHDGRRQRSYEGNRRDGSGGRWASNGSHDRNEGDRRDANDDRRARSRDHGGNADSRSGKRRTSGVVRNDIRFRPRTSQGESDRHQVRASQQVLSRRMQHSTSFVSPRRPTSGSGSSNSGSHFRSSSGSVRPDHVQQVAMNNSRRQIPRATPRPSGRPAAPVRTSNSTPVRQRAVERNASPPSPPRNSSGSNHRAEKRASRSKSRGTSRRSGSRSRRH
jgi:hypothetical protein